MKKDDALQWRERFLAIAEATGARLGLPLAEDGKLYHDEVAGQARWAQRFSRPGRWPHRAAPDACPGLRYEIWYPAGKDEVLRFVLLCDAERGLDALQTALAPTFRELVEGGRYARRYKAIGPEVQGFYAGAVGIERGAPARAEKAEPAFSQFLDDTLRPIESALAAWDADGTALARFEAACAAYDPLSALRAKFGGR